MRYLPKSPAERQEMLAAIGAKSIDELICSIPERFRLRGEFERVHELSRRGRLQSPALRGDGRHHPARRVPHLLHALSGGNHAGHAAGDLRVSDADVPAHGPGSSERVDVRWFDGNDGSRADGGAPDGPPARAGGAIRASGIPRGTEDLREEFRFARGGDSVYSERNGGCESVAGSLER